MAGKGEECKKREIILFIQIRDHRIRDQKISFPHMYMLLRIAVFPALFVTHYKFNLMLGGIITICGGILAASGFIIAKKPNAKELIDKLTPYQGWIGIVMFVWGIWEILGCIRLMSWLHDFPMRWTFWMLCGVADLLVGFLMGYGLLVKYTLRNNAVAIEKSEVVRLKLLGYQVPLGFLAIIMGILYIIF
jgi:hypothetical protein